MKITLIGNTPIRENEMWADIDGYNGLYQVSNLGRVKSLNRVIIRCNKHYKKI